MPVTRSRNIKEQTDRINGVDFTKWNAAAVTNKENQVSAIMKTYISDTLAATTNFLEYSENNIELLQELQVTLDGLNRAAIAPEVAAAKIVITNLLNHVETVKNATDNVKAPEDTPTLYIWTARDVDLTSYFETWVIPSLRLSETVWSPKRITIKSPSGGTWTRNWTTWAGSNLNITWNNLNLNISAWDLPGWLRRESYPLTIELDFLSERWAWVSRLQTKRKVKINIKEPVNVIGVLWWTFSSTETYRDTLDTRLHNYYNVNAESVIREYILERINKSWWSLSDTQKDILVDYIFNDGGLVNGDTDTVYTAANLQAYFPTRIENESVWGDGGYRDALRNLLINPEQFNTKAKEVFLDRLRNQRNATWFIINDDVINQQVNELIQEQAANSIWNITNNDLPWLFTTLSNRNNTAVRHQNRHRTGFRWYKKILWIFKWKKRRKLTDISTNNYFSFLSWTSYNINDDIQVAGKKINQDIKLDMNSRNNISASVKVTWDEETNFEFAGASSIYELMTGILWNTEVWPVTKVYLVFNIYKQFYKKMQELFGTQDIIVGWNTYKIDTKDKLKITMNWDNLFDEEQFRKLESSVDLQWYMATLATNFNLIMWTNNQRYVRWMTIRNQNRIKIWDEMVGRILRKRRNADFNFKTEVEWVNISYEDRKFTVNYDGQEIKANRIETILSHKIFEWKQVQIMKAIYREFLHNTAKDPKAQKLLERNSAIGFVVPYDGVDYVVSTQWWEVRFGTIPAWFPTNNVDRRRWLLTGWMYSTISEDEILSNPALASNLIRSLRWYRRQRVRWVNYWS